MRNALFLLALLCCSIAQAESDLLVNGDFESGATGWHFELWPRPAETPVGSAIAVSDAQAKSGRHSLRIDTGAVADKQKELVFNADIRDESRATAGKRLDLSGWTYVEPGTAVRPISMTLRVWGSNDDPGKGGLLGTPISIHVAGAPGKWTQFQASAVIPDGRITHMDLHCGIRPDVAGTVLYLDDLQLREHVPAPLEISAFSDPQWRDAMAGIDVRLKSVSPPNGSLSLQLLDADARPAAHWDRVLPAGTKHGAVGLNLPRPFLREGKYQLKAELRDGAKVIETATAEIELAESPWESHDPKPLPSGTIDGKRPAGFTNEGTVAPVAVADVVPAEAEPEPALLKSPEQQPLVVFGRNAFDPISRLARPRPGERDEPRVFACPGQYVPVQIGIWARTPVKRLAFGTLAVAGRLQVSPELIDVRAVRMPHNLPPFLERRDSIEVPEGQTQAYWVTLFIPPGTKPGFYQALLQASADSAKLESVSILIRVLPCELPVAKKGYGFWWKMDDRWNGYYAKPHDVGLEQVRKQFVLLREHECNVVSLYSVPKISRSADGTFAFDFTRDQLGNSPYSFDQIVRLGLETKFLTTSQPIQYPGADELRHDYVARELKLKLGSPEFDAFYRQACHAIDEWAKSKGITLAFACVDEIGNSVERQEQALHYYAIAKQAGVLTSVTDNSMWGGQYLTAQPRFDQVIDMRVFNFVLPEMIQTTRASGDRLWLYNLGDVAMSPRRDRLIFGLFTERCGADGYLQWALQWPHQNKSPYESAAAGRYEPYHYVLPAPDGPLSSVGFEAVREGITDARYEALAEGAGLNGLDYLPSDLPQDSTAIGSFLDRHGTNFNDVLRWKAARAVLNKRH